uniref:Innexin n=1 Tax=Macrostomum lignano TaxID=282301 RepID=A0A1I8F253_9PLAT
SSPGWEEYAENYCWVANTYYASVQAEHLPSEHMRRKRMVTYYQWAPIVLAVQALMFYPALPDLASIHELLWFQRAQNSPDGYRWQCGDTRGAQQARQVHGQCVLAAEHVPEKIFVFLWFWHIPGQRYHPRSSFVSWSSVWPSPAAVLGFVRKYLKIMKRSEGRRTRTTSAQVPLPAPGRRVHPAPDRDELRATSWAGDLACELWSIYRHKRLQELEESTKVEAELHRIPAFSCSNGNGDDNIV